MELNKYVGSRIKKFRESRNLTQDDLADQLHTTRQTISRYETGDRKVNQDILFQLSELFNVKVDDFFPEREQSNDNANLLAAHINDDVSSEDMKRILDYIELIKRGNNK